MDQSTLARAQAGDGAAFEDLVRPYRQELHVHCYRILGSVQDAEDVLHRLVARRDVESGAARRRIELVQLEIGGLRDDATTLLDGELE